LNAFYPSILKNAAKLQYFQHNTALNNEKNH